MFIRRILGIFFGFIYFLIRLKFFFEKATNKNRSLVEFFEIKFHQIRVKMKNQKDNQNVINRNIKNVNVDRDFFFLIE